MLASKKELANLKLQSIRSDDLKILANSLGIDSRGKSGDIVKRLIDIPQDQIDEFIKRKYQDLTRERQTIISDEDLKEELMKVKDFHWGVIQGQLDQKIQTEYVRRFTRYEDLIQGVKSKLHDDVTGYVIATWYNHWTTVLIEDHISHHPRIIPTLKNYKGIDIFFDGQPFDLKITYPKEYITKYGIDKMIKEPQHLAIWMYEHQGPQRFGSDNRFFVVLVNKENLENSWKLKRDFNFIFSEIDKFLDTATVSLKDEIVFAFNKKTYTTISKILLIAK